MGRHERAAAHQWKEWNFEGDPDPSAPPLDDLEEAFEKNTESTLKKLIEVLYKLHPFKRLYLISGITKRIFVDTIFEIDLRPKIISELEKLAHSTKEEIKKTGISKKKMEDILSKVPEATWDELPAFCIPNSNKIPWNSTSKKLASYIKHMCDNQAIKDFSRSAVCRAFASIFYDAKTGKEINPASLDALIASFNNGEKKADPL